MGFENRPKDFFAKQIRSSHLIASGGIIDPESSDWDEQLPNLRMMIYPREALEIEGTGTDSVPTEYIEGAFEGIVPPKLIDDPVDLDNGSGSGLKVGDDVWLFISGAQHTQHTYDADGVEEEHDAEVEKRGKSGVVLFGGDVVISGTLFAERQVIEVDLSQEGELFISGNLVAQDYERNVNFVQFMAPEYGYPRDWLTDEAAALMFNPFQIVDEEETGTTRVEATLDEVETIPVLMVKDSTGYWVNILGVTHTYEWVRQEELARSEEFIEGTSVEWTGGGTPWAIGDYTDHSDQLGTCTGGWGTASDGTICLVGDCPPGETWSDNILEADCPEDETWTANPSGPEWTIGDVFTVRELNFAFEKLIAAGPIEGTLNWPVYELQPDGSFVTVPECEPAVYDFRSGTIESEACIDSYDPRPTGSDPDLPDNHQWRVQTNDDGHTIFDGDNPAYALDEFGFKIPEPYTNTDGQPLYADGRAPGVAHTLFNINSIDHYVSINHNVPSASLDVRRQNFEELGDDGTACGGPYNQKDRVILLAHAEDNIGAAGSNPLKSNKGEWAADGLIHHEDTAFYAWGVPGGKHNFEVEGHGGPDYTVGVFGGDLVVSGILYNEGGMLDLSSRHDHIGSPHDNAAFGAATDSPLLTDGTVIGTLQFSGEELEADDHPPAQGPGAKIEAEAAGDWIGHATDTHNLPTRLNFYTNSGQDHTNWDPTGPLNTCDTDPDFDTSTQTPQMTIAHDGDVGIGDENPRSRLDIRKPALALNDVGEFENYHLSLRNQNGVNGEAIGIAFGNSSDEDEVGASILFKKTDTASKGELQVYTKRNSGDDTTPVQAMVIDDAGNVGIGLWDGTPDSTTAAAQLHVFGEDDSETTLKVENHADDFGARVLIDSNDDAGITLRADDNTFIRFKQDGETNKALIGQANGTTLVDDIVIEHLNNDATVVATDLNDLQLGTKEEVHVTVTGGDDGTQGRVGIGTNNPVDSKLHVVIDDTDDRDDSEDLDIIARFQSSIDDSKVKGIRVDSTNSAGVNKVFADIAVDAEAQKVGLGIGVEGDGNLPIGADDLTEAEIILDLANDNVGIGTHEPTSDTKLHVVNDDAGREAIIRLNDDDSGVNVDLRAGGGDVGAEYGAVGTVTSNDFKIIAGTDPDNVAVTVAADADSVGIGTESPEARLHVDTQVELGDQTYTVTREYLDADGNIATATEDITVTGDANEAKFWYLGNPFEDVSEVGKWTYALDDGTVGWADQIQDPLKLIGLKEDELAYGFSDNPGRPKFLVVQEDGTVKFKQYFSTTLGPDRDGRVWDNDPAKGDGEDPAANEDNASYDNGLIENWDGDTEVGHALDDVNKALGDHEERITTVETAIGDCVTDDGRISLGAADEGYDPTDTTICIALSNHETRITNIEDSVGDVIEDISNLETIICLNEDETGITLDNPTAGSLEWDNLETPTVCGALNELKEDISKVISDAIGDCYSPDATDVDGDYHFSLSEWNPDVDSFNPENTNICEALSNHESRINELEIDDTKRAWTWQDKDSHLPDGDVEGEVVKLRAMADFVGVGIEDPLQKLHVHGGEASNAGLRIETMETAFDEDGFEILDDEGNPTIVNVAPAANLELALNGQIHGTLSQIAKPTKSTKDGTDTILQNHSLKGGIYMATYNQDENGCDVAVAPLVIDSNDNAYVEDLQVLILSGTTTQSDPDALNPREFGDTNFFVSGSIGSCVDPYGDGSVQPTGNDTRGTAVFGGDVYVSGTIFPQGYGGLDDALANSNALAWQWPDLDSVAGGDKVILRDITNYVGIGTPDPCEKVHVHGGWDSNPAIRIETNQYDNRGNLTNACPSVSLDLAFDGCVHGSLYQIAKDDHLVADGSDTVLENLSSGGIHMTTNHCGVDDEGNEEQYRLSPVVITPDISVNEQDPPDLQVLILSGTTSRNDPTALDPTTFGDTNFFVSGSIGSCADPNNDGSPWNGKRGTAVFGGDVYISGCLYVKGPGCEGGIGGGSSKWRTAFNGVCIDVFDDISGYQNYASVKVPTTSTSDAYSVNEHVIIRAQLAGASVTYSNSSVVSDVAHAIDGTPVYLIYDESWSGWDALSTETLVDIVWADGIVEFEVDNNGDGDPETTESVWTYENAALTIRWRGQPTVGNIIDAMDAYFAASVNTTPVKMYAIRNKDTLWYPNLPADTQYTQTFALANGRNSSRFVSWGADSTSGTTPTENTATQLVAYNNTWAGSDSDGSGVVEGDEATMVPILQGGGGDTFTYQQWVQGITIPYDCRIVGFSVRYIARDPLDTWDPDLDLDGDGYPDTSADAAKVMWTIGKINRASSPDIPPPGQDRVPSTGSWITPEDPAMSVVYVPEPTSTLEWTKDDEISEGGSGYPIKWVNDLNILVTEGDTIAVQALEVGEVLGDFGAEASVTVWVEGLSSQEESQLDEPQAAITKANVIRVNSSAMTTGYHDGLAVYEYNLQINSLYSKTVVFVDIQVGENIIINLPAAGELDDGTEIVIKDSSGNAAASETSLKIHGHEDECIDGESCVDFELAGAAITLIDIGAEWQIT